MTPRAIRAPFEAATVQTPIAFDAIVAAEGRPPGCGALGVGRAGPAERDVATPAACAHWPADTFCAIKSATAVCPGRTATTFISAAVECAVAGYAVAVTEDGATSLTALASGRALSTEPDCSARAAPGAADAISANQAPTTDSIPITPAAAVVTTVQRAVGVDPVRRADGGSRRLAALPGLRA